MTASADVFGSNKPRVLLPGAGALDDRGGGGGEGVRVGVCVIGDKAVGLFVDRSPRRYQGVVDICVVVDARCVCDWTTKG